MSTHNLCFEQKYEKYQSFLSENFQFLEVKFSIHLNRCVFVMVVQRRKICNVKKIELFSFVLNLDVITLDIDGFKSRNRASVSE